ncbi:MAG: hypothetical protein A2126_01865 [Candidatus Woykebacteria bacterium GWB1_45_5]|uniref:DUF4012 domain-containing protein n=2 Tax=Candidatus Woykeibacteriota TaxID=1817899 RepID=A0A1G1W1V8_9BACT|nr:MAG: hypothetical protein A2113_03875 [Candidatus Woykebacteria bacterium GWA1_44_8]OGY23043.1 MAG: hypothetical protein A2126_01865 [Candidatus Woykebacteria bacterium GWB1_45_5]
MPITHVTLDGEKLVRGKRKGKWLKIFLTTFLVLFILVAAPSVYFYPKVKTLSADLNLVSQGSQKVQKAIEVQDIAKAKEEVSGLHSSLRKTETDLEKLHLVGRLPLVNGYYNDATHALRAGILGAQAGEMVIDSILPFSDILGFKGAKSDLKAEEKVEALVTKVFPSLSPKATELEKMLGEIKNEVDQIRPERYPDNFTVKGYRIHETLVTAQEGLNKAEEYLPVLKDALDSLPQTLGYQQEKTYLLWFQNDKELRPTGGFLTAYAIARVKNGKLLDIESDDIYELDKKFTPFEPPPPVLKYVNTLIFTVRDSNLSPDFKLSAEKFESFYTRIKNMPKIDGIIAIDTELVRKFLEVTGPIKTKKHKETFSAEIDKKYKIPDVVYKLELYAEKIHSQSTDRKAIIGDLMDSMLEKLFSAPPDKFPKILETFLAAAEAKNVLFYFHDQGAQSLAEDLNYAGRIKDFDGDYLHVNNANFGGLKGNLYIKASVNQDITIANDGTVTKKVAVTLSNTEKADGWLNSYYQNWMRVYVPEGSRLLEKKVSKDFAEKKEIGKMVWESFSVTYPLKSSETYFSYQLPFKVKKGDIYKLLIQKQPGTTDPHMVIRVNGKKIQEFDLKKDTEIEFKV